MVTPEEFHQQSDSQAYADNVRPCAEMLFAALLEVRPVDSTACLACNSAICCGSVCRLALNAWQRRRRAPTGDILMTSNCWLCLCPRLSQEWSCAL